MLCLKGRKKREKEKNRKGNFENCKQMEVKEKSKKETEWKGRDKKRRERKK